MSTDPIPCILVVILSNNVIGLTKRHSTSPTTWGSMVRRGDATATPQEKDSERNKMHRVLAVGRVVSCHGKR